MTKILLACSAVKSLRRWRVVGNKVGITPVWPRPQSTKLFSVQVREAVCRLCPVQGVDEGSNELQIIIAHVIQFPFRGTKRSQNVTQIIRNHLLLKLVYIVGPNLTFYIKKNRSKLPEFRFIVKVVIFLLWRREDLTLKNSAPIFQGGIKMYEYLLFFCLYFDVFQNMEFWRTGQQLGTL